MNVYLDNCIFNRPFDDQSFERIHLETQFFLVLLKKIEESQVTLTTSFANIYEAKKMNDFVRHQKIKVYMDLATYFIGFSDEIQTRAHLLNGFGFGPMDSVHIAAAETSSVDYFVTCDDDLIKTARRNTVQLRIKVVTLYELIELLYYA